jgi:hypothetical protein
MATEESMNKWTSALVGAIVGAGASTLFLYLFAPARGTTFDDKYQSRLDWALAEGDKAGKEREQELLQELDNARSPKPPSLPIPDVQLPKKS